MLDAYVVSLDLVRSLRPLVDRLASRDRNLADQLRRAATSVVLNVGEGRLRRAGDQRRSFEIAAGSASEVRSALDVAEAWGWAGDLADARALVERVNSMLWVLTRGRSG